MIGLLARAYDGEEKRDSVTIRSGRDESANVFRYMSHRGRRFRDS